jgi:uncharacterized protein (TIGR03382 family)
MHFTKKLCFLFCCTLKCHANFSSARSGTPYESFSVPIDFSIDAKWGHLTRIELGDPKGIDQIDASDLRIGIDSGICSNIACGLADIGFIKKFVVDQFIKPQIKKLVNEQADKATCRVCSKGANCTAPLEGSCCPSGSTCQDKVCEDAATKRCLPRMIGMQGGLQTSGLTGSLGAPSGDSGTIPMLVAAGATVASDSGLTLGFIAGARAAVASPCVGDLPPPPSRTVTVPRFEALGPAGHHVGFAVSQHYLETFAYQLHRSGGMCLSIGSATSDALSTGTMKILLPSLGVVAGEKDATMRVVLRPTQAPVLTVGEGTFDPVTKKPVKPLLSLSLEDVVVDFYAYVEDRHVRLFTLRVDFKLPFSLIVEGGCSGQGTAAAQSVTLALGDLKQLVTNVRASNSEILDEDPQVLSQLIPLIVGLAEPSLAKAIKPIPLPDVNGLLIKINSLKGVVPASKPDAFEHLAGFAQLRLKGGVCASFAPRTIATLLESRIPPSEEGAGVGRAVVWPVAVLGVTAESAGRAVEHAYRVNGGFWSTWLPGPTLTVTHPAFLVQGAHTIEVRSQVVDDPDTIEPVPAQVTFLVDTLGPEIAFQVDRARNLLEVSARDAVTPEDRLLFAYRLGDERESAYGRVRPVDLSAIERAGGSVEVFSRDEAGNVGSRTFRVPVARVTSIASRSESRPAAVDSNAEAAGCSSAGSSGVSAIGALLLLAGAWTVRRSRR